jgi:hypothetical protein
VPSSRSSRSISSWLTTLIRRTSSKRKTVSRMAVSTALPTSSRGLPLRPARAPSAAA